MFTNCDHFEVSDAVFDLVFIARKFLNIWHKVHFSTKKSNLNFIHNSRQFL